MTEITTASPATHLSRIRWHDRLTAAGIHLGASIGIATLAAILVFFVWYPGAFRELAGGRDLFLLLTSVDVVLGPLLTLAVFDRAKSRRHLRLDLGIIAAIQLGALVYGLHTAFIVRPVAMVFEVDRMRLVIANDVAVDELPRASPAYRALPLTGPWLLAARVPRAGAERTDALLQGLSGKDVSVRPTFWQPYDDARARALVRSRPIAALLEHYRSRADEIRQRLAVMNADPTRVRFLPVMARTPWTAVLDDEGRLLGYLPLDGFI